MTIRLLVTAVGIALLLASPGWAQSATTTTGSFNRLSPGGQKIATALFSAQNVKGTTLTPLTKNQIADLKGKEGWGRVFKEMKADGLIQAKNLGQVVSQHENSLHTSTTSTTRRSTSTSTTAATRSGRSTTRTGSSVSGAFVTNGRGVTTGPHPMGGGVATNATGGFSHGGGMGGGFGGGMGGGGMGGGHGGGHGR